MTRALKVRWMQAAQPLYGTRPGNHYDVGGAAADVAWAAAAARKRLKVVTSQAVLFGSTVVESEAVALGQQRPEHAHACCKRTSVIQRYRRETYQGLGCILSAAC